MAAIQDSDMIWTRATANGLLQAPMPATITHDGYRRSTSVLVARSDWDTLASAGWYRTQRDPLPAYADGYADPVIGTDDKGYPIVIITAIVSAEAERAQRAKAALLTRIVAERDRRADAMMAPGITDPARIIRARDQVIQTAIELTAARQQREMTAAETDTEAAITDASAAVRSLTDTANALYGWCLTELLTFDAMDDMDVAAPPADAPQWP